MIRLQGVLLEDLLGTVLPLLAQLLGGRNNLLFSPLFFLLKRFNIQCFVKFFDPESGGHVFGSKRFGRLNSVHLLLIRRVLQLIERIALDGRGLQVVTAGYPLAFQDTLRFLGMETSAI